MDLGGVVSVRIHADPIPPAIHRDILEHPRNPNLQAYMGFVQNCRARQKMEHRLRKEEWGLLSASASVSIPEPGVVVIPEEDDDDDDDDDDDGKWEDDSNSRRSQGDEGSWTKDEVDSWVSDQSDKKR